MKIVFIVFCFAFAAFAQEQQEKHDEYKNFTSEQRHGTFGLNIIPGLGSIIIMDDWEGARVQWFLFGIGAASTGLLIAKGGIDSSPSTFDIGGVMLAITGLFFLGTDFFYNIFRSATYNKPEYIQQPLEENSYRNFSTGQRFGTFGLNIIPGLGSVIIMEDWVGAKVQWFFLSIALIDFTIINFGIYQVFLLSSIGSNIHRSSTYDKPKSLTLDKYDGFHLSALPNRHGKIMPYLLFNKTF